MNRIIKLLMISDVFVLTGFGLVQPILAIFIKDNLVGGTIFAAGLVQHSVSYHQIIDTASVFPICR